MNERSGFGRRGAGGVKEKIGDIWKGRSVSAGLACQAVRLMCQRRGDAQQPSDGSNGLCVDTFEFRPNEGQGGDDVPSLVPTSINDTTPRRYTCHGAHR